MEPVTSDQVREAAAARILGRRDELLAEQAVIRNEQARLAARDRDIERELAECRAAAKFFDLAFDPPPDQREIADLRTQVTAWRRRADAAYERGETAEAVDWRNRAKALEVRLLRAMAEAERFVIQGTLAIRQEAQSSAQKEAPEAIEKPVPSAPASKMPRIRDIALNQLRLAEPAGMKALPIRRYIEDIYSIKLHSKTVGMTLYRLLKEKLVHRKGQTWFYGPQAEQSLPASPEDPGAGTPGVAHDVG
jgi:hypothetical protein